MPCQVYGLTRESFINTLKKYIHLDPAFHIHYGCLMREGYGSEATQMLMQILRGLATERTCLVTKYSDTLLYALCGRYPFRGILLNNEIEKLKLSKQCIIVEYDFNDVLDYHRIVNELTQNDVTIVGSVCLVNGIKDPEVYRPDRMTPLFNYRWVVDATETNENGQIVLR